MEKTMDRGREKAVQPFCGTGNSFCRPKWCGVFMIVAGLLWLGAKLNWINPDFFWPFLLIAVGMVITFSVLFRRGEQTRGFSGQSGH